MITIRAAAAIRKENAAFSLGLWSASSATDNGAIMNTRLVETVDRRKITEPEARAIAELLVAVWPRSEKTIETRMGHLMTYWRDYRGPETNSPGLLSFAITAE